MANPWFRMYSEFASDPKVQMMSEVMQRRLVMLFCMRCSDVTVTLCDAEIAFHLRISEPDLEETKAAFMAKGFIDSEWNIANWDKRQYASDSSAARTKAYRERQKNKDVTSHVTDGDALEQIQNRKDTDKKKSPASPTGSRLPADWSLPDEWRHWAITERPDVDPNREASTFADYWTSVAGAKGRKADWQATWRNWIRRANSTAGYRGTSGNQGNRRKEL